MGDNTRGDRLMEKRKKWVEARGCRSMFLVVKIGCDMWDPLVVLLRFVENVVRPRAPS